MPPPTNDRVTEEELDDRLTATVEDQHTELGKDLYTATHNQKALFFHLWRFETRLGVQIVELKKETRGCVEAIDGLRREFGMAMEYNFRHAAEEKSLLEAQLRGCQADNVCLAQQVRDLTDVVGQLIDKTRMLETRVKTEEESEEGGVKREEVGVKEEGMA
jgi:hypothetical protein